MRRAIRLFVDIGMHLQMQLPSGVLPKVDGERIWTYGLPVEFFAEHRHSTDFVTSEVVRYLGRSGQAISMNRSSCSVRS